MKYTKHVLTVAILAIFLVACGAGGSDSSDSQNNTNSSLPLINVSGVGQALTVSRLDKVNVSVSGVRTVATIDNNVKIGVLDLSGVSVKLIIRAGVKIDKINISGVSCIVQIPQGVLSDYASEISSSGVAYQVILSNGA